MGKLDVLTTATKIGSTSIPNRVALAPLTRGRASEQHVPQLSGLAELYYEQRADPKEGAGLIIGEATGISQQGLGWYRAPGIWSEEQTEAWKVVIEKVHAKGAAFSMQLWHQGRAAAASVTGQKIVAASPLPLSGEVTGKRGVKEPYETPKELTAKEIKGIVADYAKGAKNSFKAGADMVECHFANGYLGDVFIQSCSNKRTDKYGGSVENRLRFPREVLVACIAAAGGNAGKVGCRFSPNGAFQEMGHENNLETFDEALKMVAELKLGFVHIMDGLTFGFHEKTEPYTLERARGVLKKHGGENVTIIGNVGYDGDSAAAVIDAGHADMIAFGRPFIANPDLLKRYLHGLPVVEADYPSWWQWDKHADGYTDWPRHGEEEGKGDAAAEPAAEAEGGKAAKGKKKGGAKAAKKDGAKGEGGKKKKKAKADA